MNAPTKFLILGPLVALAAAPAAAAEDEVATPAQIAEAIDACEAVTSTDKVEFRRLESLGFPTAEKRGANRGRNKVIGAHQKPGNPVLVVIADEQVENKTCLVRVKLAQTTDYAPTLQGLSEIIGMPVRAEANSYFWTLEGHEMRVDPAGDAKEPVARFEISATQTPATPADQQETAE
ncbi:hypothetical protein AAG612_07230 [Citromicrobium bathyomarinum]|uniref:hypothetical protein n=1 Tax=Citromicrobium bathyomarinum TaxID=72174 RepID=UPI003159F275